jgi:hypothetical protein
LLLLAAREVAARRWRICPMTGNSSNSSGGTVRRAPFDARPMRRLSMTESRPKISRPCGT